MSDFAKQAVADIARTVRELKESPTSSMGREDGGHFSFVIPERVIIAPSKGIPTDPLEKKSR
jgi:hypothetical protein